MDDLINKKFGRLTVLSLHEIRQRYTDSGAKNGKYYYYLCKCECGNNIIVERHNLTSGNSKSCGCYNHDKIMERCYKHNGCKEKLYCVYRGMLQRCNCKSHKYYKNYGGRGIKVCDEWKDYTSFRKWSINNGYKIGLSIDRIDNNKGYSPDNCRWTTPTIQARNTRRSRFIEFNGEKLTMIEWSERTGVPSGTLWLRLKNGWDVDRALSTPVNKYANGEMNTIQKEGE